MDLYFDEMQKLTHACNIATQTLHILYEQESQEIENLKEMYENKQE